MRKLLLGLLSLLLIPSIAYGAIAFDATADGGSQDIPTNASLTWTMTNTGSTDIDIITMFSTNSGIGYSATDNGIAMTELPITTQGGSGGGDIAVFYFQATTTVNQMVCKSNAGAIDTIVQCNSTSYSGALGGIGASVSSPTLSAVTSTTTKLTVGTNSWTILGSRWQGNTISAGTGSSKRTASGGAGGVTSFDSNGAVSGNTSMTITAASGQPGVVMAELQLTAPAASSPAPDDGFVQFE